MQTDSTKTASIAIITVCFNEEKNIQSTIQSVLSQKGAVIEYWIVDGHSTDNTIAIIQECIAHNENSDIRVHVISEKDKGIFDAMNKGTRLCNAEWVQFLNAGDLLFDEDVIRNVGDILLQEEAADIIYGDAVLFSNKKYQILRVKSINNLVAKKCMVLCHQSCFTRKRILLEHPFSLQYRIAADFDFYLWAYLQNKRSVHVPLIVSMFLLDGTSSSDYWHTASEECMVLIDHHIVTSTTAHWDKWKKRIAHELRYVLNSCFIFRPIISLHHSRSRSWIFHDNMTPTQIVNAIKSNYGKL